jgi:type IV pilus assembly protein PilA
MALNMRLTLASSPRRYSPLTERRSKQEIFKMRRQKGFSLIELLIVVAIILIIAAIAIPNLMRSRMTANEAAAASTVRTLNTTEVTYSTTYPTSGFAGTLTALGPGAATCAAPHPDATNACLIDFTLGCATATCTKDAFKYTITGVGAAAPFTDYVIFATPVGPSSAAKDYCSVGDAVVRFQVDQAAPAATPITTSSACTALTSL